MSIPKRVSAVTAVLGLVFSLIGFTALSTANATGTETIKVTSGDLKWGFIQRWRSHMEMPIMGAPGVTTGHNGVSVAPDADTRKAPDYGYGWHTDAATTINPNAANSIAFPGGLQYQKYKIPPSTDYLVDSTINNLRLRIDNPTSATLVADLTYRKGASMDNPMALVPIATTQNVEIATVDLSASPIDYTASTITVTNAPTTITEAGADIVGGRTVYGNKPGDPVSFTLELQKTISVTPDDSQPATPTLQIDKKSYKASENITTTLENLVANKEVDLFLDSLSTKMGSVAAGADGRATFTAPLPSSLSAGKHKVLVAYKGETKTVAEAEFDVVASTVQPPKPPAPPTPGRPEIAPAPAAPEKPQQSDEPRCVADPQVRGVVNGGLNWTFSRSFYSYILSSIGSSGRGVITPRAGATLNNGTFIYPATHPGSMINVGKKTGRINFGGNFNFYKHSGVLNLTLSNPTLVVTSPTTGYLELSVSSTDMTGKPVIPGRIRFADVTFANANFTKDSFNATTSSVVLTEQGAKAFAGFYKAGKQLDNLTVNVKLSDKVTCYDANGNPVLSSTGANGEYALTAIALLSLIGVFGITISRKMAK